MIAIRKIRYTIRAVLILILVVCLILALHSATTAKHRYACLVIEKHGAIQCNGFEDPIGPNSWYGGFSNNFPIPSNGFFSPWFAKLFCVTGYTDCEIKNLRSDSNAWEYFRYLHHLRSLDISSSNFPANWSSQLNCPELRFLCLEISDVSEKNYRELGEIKNLETLIFSQLTITISEIDSFSHLKQLKFLGFANCNISTNILNEIKVKLPSCDVIILDE